MLICMGELLQTSGFQSTKRVGKCLFLFQYLYENLPAGAKDLNKYLMGTLFILGGMLKLEAKSYLNTRKKDKDSFHMVSPLFNEENPIDNNDQ